MSTPRPISEPSAPVESGGNSSSQWWRHAVIYQVYPRSFNDSDSDGIGDIPGITERIGYLRELGVDAIWLSPFYPSPQVDMGYDVSDYCDVDPVYGTLADFDELLDQAHARRIRVIIDIVPNHCSDHHPLFQKALAAGPGSAERDMFIFRDGRGSDGGEPPNNWPGSDQGRAWTRVFDAEGRPEQWYLHLFDKAQPDWNWENPAVAQMFDEILRFWLNRGVDGFRVDVSHGMIKARGLPDHHSSVSRVIQTVDPSTRPPMWDQDGVHEIHRRWRRVVDEYPGERVLVAEAWLEPERGRLYVRPDEMHQSFNFSFLVTPWHAPELRRTIESSLASDGLVGAPTTWVLSNHDVIRHSTRFGYPLGTELPNGLGADDPQPDQTLGLRRARAATLVQLALPGSSYLYQGEELGLPEVTDLPVEALTDYIWFSSGGRERGRDGCRVPLPWSGDHTPFGFSDTDSTWLPVPEWFGEFTVERQQFDPNSTLLLYRRALHLRRQFALGAGRLERLEANDSVLCMRNGELLVVANTGTDPVVLSLPSRIHPILTSWALPTSVVDEPATDHFVIPADTTWWLTVPPAS